MQPNYADFTTKNPNPLKSLWIGKCTIFEYQTTKDEITKQSTQKQVAVVVDEPCKVSYNKEQATNIASGAAVISQSITLFVRPDLEVKPGSVIEVTQHGKTTKYKGSSKSAVYTNHQEIVLELFEDTV